jgi:hypothetical protein
MQLGGMSFTYPHIHIRTITVNKMERSALSFRFIFRFRFEILNLKRGQVTHIYKMWLLMQSLLRNSNKPDRIGKTRKQVEKCNVLSYENVLMYLSNHFWTTHTPRQQEFCMSNYKTKRFFSDPAILHERTSGEFSVPTCFPSVYAYMHNYSDSYLGQVIVIYMHGHAHGIRHSRYSSICLRFHRYISFDSRKYI